MGGRLDLFLRFCEARSSLYENLKRRLPADHDSSDDISAHSIVDIFEFIYMIKATEIDSGNKIGRLAEAHNISCNKLLSMDGQSLAKLGLNKTKIRDSLFSEKNIKKLKSNYELMRAIDQSDISRFLYKHMSRETARKALILFDKASLIQRIDAGDSILIKLNGQAESVFEQYLIELMSPAEQCRD